MFLCSYVPMFSLQVPYSLPVLPQSQCALSFVPLKTGGVSSSHNLHNNTISQCLSPYFNNLSAKVQGISKGIYRNQDSPGGGGMMDQQSKSWFGLGLAKSAGRIMSRIGKPKQ